MIDFLTAISKTHLIVKNKYSIDNPYSFLTDDQRIRSILSDSTIVFTDIEEEGTNITVHKRSDSLYEMNLIFLDKVYISGTYKIHTENKMLEEVELNVLPMWISSIDEPIIDISKEYITSIQKGCRGFNDENYVLIDKWFHHSFATMKRLFHYIKEEPNFGISKRWSSGIHRYYKVLKFPEHKNLSSFFTSEFKIVTELISIWDGVDKRTVKLLTNVTSSFNELLQFENTFYYSIDHNLECSVSSLFEKSYIHLIKQDTNKHIFDFLPESLQSESSTRGYIYSTRDKNKKKVKLVLNDITIEDSYYSKNFVKQIEILDISRDKEDSSQHIEYQTDEFAIQMNQDSLEYACESNDFNPIHLSYMGARLSGLSHKVCQGMQVWLTIVKQIQLKYSQTVFSKEVCFLSPVYSNDVLNISVIKENGNSSLTVQVRNNSTEKECIKANILLIDI